MYITIVQHVVNSVNNKNQRRSDYGSLHQKYEIWIFYFYFISIMLYA